MPLYPPDAISPRYLGCLSSSGRQVARSNASGRFFALKPKQINGVRPADSDNTPHKKQTGTVICVVYTVRHVVIIGQE